LLNYLRLPTPIRFALLGLMWWACSHYYGCTWRLTMIALRSDVLEHPDKPRTICEFCTECYNAQVNFSLLCAAAVGLGRGDHAGRGRRHTLNTSSDRPEPASWGLHERYCLLRFGVLGGSATLLIPIAAVMPRDKVIVIMLLQLVLSAFTPVTPTSIDYRQKLLYIFAAGLLFTRVRG